VQTKQLTSEFIGRILSFHSSTAANDADKDVSRFVSGSSQAPSDRFLRIHQHWSIHWGGLFSIEFALEGSNRKVGRLFLFLKKSTSLSTVFFFPSLTIINS
jgi:hypothetical protein